MLDRFHSLTRTPTPTGRHGDEHDPLAEQMITRIQAKLHGSVDGPIRTDQSPPPSQPRRPSQSRQPPPPPSERQRPASSSHRRADRDPHRDRQAGSSPRSISNGAAGASRANRARGHGVSGSDGGPGRASSMPRSRAGAPQQRVDQLPYMYSGGGGSVGGGRSGGRRGGRSGSRPPSHTRSHDRQQRGHAAPAGSESTGFEAGSYDRAARPRPRPFAQEGENNLRRMDIKQTSDTIRIADLEY